jgi:hypothetical protein
MQFMNSGSPFSVEISKAALESIFDDCDNFDADETGGRLLGTYRQDGSSIAVSVTGVLPAGPNAERTPTFFLQDGDYQEKMFRAIEVAHPDVEHLGNWHTHHVNGLQTLSGGDHQLYGKIVNHANHNTNFFYALLVTRKNSRGSPRYDVKHFFFRRGDATVYEVPHKKVKVTDVPLLEPASQPAKQSPKEREASKINPERVTDQQFFEEFYPDIKAMLSKTTGSPYWKGSFALVDGTLTNVVAMEETPDHGFAYSIAVSCQNPAASEVPAMFKDRPFPNARQGVLTLERELNRAIFRGKGG